MGATPRGVHIIVSRTHIRRVGVWQPPLLRCLDDAIGWHLVEATGLEGRNTLGEDEWLVRKILWHILDPLMMVVEADDINGTTLEEVILWVWLVTSGGDRACAPRVVRLYNLGKVLGKQGVDAQLIAISQGRGIMTSIQNEVCLFQGQGIGCRIRPLFEYLVTDTPHDDARMVAVTLHEV